MNKKYRLNKTLFNEIFHKGKISYSENFIIKFNKNESHIKIGISVSKKFFKKSVTRNKIKRQIRSIVQKWIPSMKNFDLIIIIKKKYNIEKYSILEDELISLFKKNKILI